MTALGENQKALSRGASKTLSFLLLSALSGTAGGQLLGTLLVAKSNGQLWLEQQAIARLGYLAVPGRLLHLEMNALSTWLAGGLFFALSIGLGYGFLCGLLVWIFSLYKKKGYRYLRLLPVVLIMGILVWKGEGSDPMVIFFLLLVPLLLCFLSFPVLSGASLSLSEMGRYGFLFLIFLILSVVTFRHLDFIEIRDRLLLPTKVGKQVDEFYYHYTLYPARLVQPLYSRLQNLVVLEGFSRPQLSKVQTVLKQRDWFSMIADSKNDWGAQTRIIYEAAETDNKASETAHNASKIARGASSEMLFYGNANWPKGNGKNGGRGKEDPVYRVSYREFIEDPSRHLKQYSLAADPFTLLRGGCGLSLFFIIPLALAFGLFVCCIWLIRRMLALGRIKMDRHEMGRLEIGRHEMGRFKETALLLITILILFMGLNFYLRTGSHLPEDLPGLWQVAKSEEQGDRIAALQCLEDIPKSCRNHREDIVMLARDQNPVIRRFGAKFLGELAAYDETTVFPLLVSLLHDSNINVVYTAAESLGKLRTQEARDILLDLLRSNREWYIKLKTYYALKRAGWRQ